MKISKFAVVAFSTLFLIDCTTGTNKDEKDLPMST